MAEDRKPNFGKYQVSGVLGEGGMGRVWRAYDPDLEVPVAIKELKEQFRDNQNLERFFREAQIAAKCRHQNIVLITDLSKSPPYFVMEFLEARELSTYIHKGVPITLAQMVRILSQVCDGLGFLHGRGIYHRDLKPANVMLLKDDSVKITDFGISKAPFGQATMTQVIMGTIPYMSPEQITAPSKVDGRTDLWSLGVITFELTQRKHPFPGEGDINTIFHIVHSAPAAFEKMPPAVEKPLKDLLTKALQKNPDERFRSTEEFKRAVQGLLAGIPDPEAISFPFAEEVGTTTATSIITEEELLKAVGERARFLIDEIEKQSAGRTAFLPKGLHTKAMELARMAKALLAEKNVFGLDAVLKDLEAQKTAIEAGVAEGLQRLIVEAEEHSKAGRHQPAAEAWGRILEAEPGNAVAREGLERARGAIERAKELREAARAAEAQMARGRDLAAKGDLPAAIDAWKKVLQVQPGHAEASQAIKDAHQRLAALQEIENLRGQARDSLRAGKPEDARFFIKKVLERAPKDKEGLDLLAQADAMVQETSRKVRIETLREEGRRHLEARDLERARGSFTSILDLVPGDREAASALQTIEKALADQAQRRKGGEKAAEAERALGAQEFERALALFGEAAKLAPGDAAVEKGIASARASLEALKAAESEAASKEKAGDLAAAAKAWEKAISIQRAHPRAAKEIDRLAGVIKKEDERRRAEEERKRAEAERFRAEEERARLVAQRQQEIGAALDALGTELGVVREALDEKILGSVKDLVGRARKAAASTDLKVLEGALADIESARKGVKEAVQKAADAAWKDLAGPFGLIKEIPREDHDAIGAALMSRALQAVGALEAAHQKGDAKAIRDQGKGLGPLADEIRGKRDAAVAKRAAAVKEASSALEAALKANEKHLKEGTVRSAREAISRAAKDSGGPRIHPLTGHLEALKAAREGILREIQETLRSLRDQVQKARGALEAAASKNRRAVAKRPDLSKRIDSMMKEAASAASADSLESLGRLAKDLEAARASVPVDPLRFLPHAIAAAGVLAAAGGFLGWRYVQSRTTHEYSLRATPWGRVVSIQAESGASVQPPPGDSPFHRLSLLPGKYTLTVENQAAGGRETITASIPEETSGSVTFKGTDYKAGLRQLVDRDPYFAKTP